MKADGVVVDHFGTRLWRKIEPGIGRVRRCPALHLVEVLFNAVRGAQLAVLKAHTLANLQFQGVIVQLTRFFG
jgi:hypothetical protein